MDFFHKFCDDTFISKIKSDMNNIPKGKVSTPMGYSCVMCEDGGQDCPEKVLWTVQKYDAIKQLWSQTCRKDYKPLPVKACTVDLSGPGEDDPETEDPNAEVDPEKVAVKGHFTIEIAHKYEKEVFASGDGGFHSASTIQTKYGKVNQLDDGTYNFENGFI